MSRNKLLIGLSVFVISLFNYKIAKFVFELIQKYLPDFSYSFLVSSIWLLIALLPVISIGYYKSGLFFDGKITLKNKGELLAYSSLVILGLILFVNFGITKYFHSVRSPFIFFFVTPIVEELIFRGYVYGSVSKFRKLSPVILSSAMFGLHHLQYFNFSLTRFAIFQVVYTFILGLLFGKIRKLSGSIYIGLLLHILINTVSVYF